MENKSKTMPTSLFTNILKTSIMDTLLDFVHKHTRLCSSLKNLVVSVAMYTYIVIMHIITILIISTWMNRKDKRIPSANTCGLFLILVRFSIFSKVLKNLHNATGISSVRLLNYSKLLCILYSSVFFSQSLVSFDLYLIRLIFQLCII